MPIEQSKPDAPKAATKQSEADRAEAGRNAAGGTEASVKRQEIDREREARDEAKAKQTRELQAKEAEKLKEAERLRAEGQKEGRGGTGDEGKPRTIQEREEDATMSSYKGAGGRDTPDNELEMRQRGDIRSIPDYEPGLTHNQEAEAYYTSAIRTAEMEARGTLSTLRNLQQPDPYTAFQPPESFGPLVDSFEKCLDGWSKQAGIVREKTPEGVTA